MKSHIIRGRFQAFFKSRFARVKSKGTLDFRLKCPKREYFRLGAESYSSLERVGRKERKIACPLLDVFACGQVSSPRLYRFRTILGKKYPSISIPKFFEGLKFHNSGLLEHYEM